MSAQARKISLDRYPSVPPKMREYGAVFWAPFNEAWDIPYFYDFISGQRFEVTPRDVSNPLINARLDAGFSTAGFSYLKSGLTQIPDLSDGYTFLLTGVKGGNTASTPFIYAGTDSGINRHYYRFRVTGTVWGVEVYDSGWNTITWEVTGVINTAPFKEDFRYNQAYAFDAFDGLNQVRGVSCDVDLDAAKNEDPIFGVAPNTAPRDLSRDIAIYTRTQTNTAGANNCHLEELVILNKPLSDAEMAQWARNPREFWLPPRKYYPVFTGAPPSDDVIVTLGQAAQVGTDATAPTVDFPLDQIVNLGQAAQAGTDATVPTVESPDPTEDTNVFLGQAARTGLDATAPQIEFRLDQIVNLANAAASGTDATAPIVDAGANVIVTLGNAAAAGIDATVPEVITELTHIVNLGQAAQAGTDATAPQVEGEPFLPPSITVPTQNQTLQFNQTSVIPAPLFDSGTGSNITWSLPVDEFSAQPGVSNFTINPTTGDINYTIAQLTTDADVQALNTKGPYNITRRVTTTVGNDDESWQIAVNVGSYTLEFTPGSKLVTWETATPLARGLQTDKDLSAPVTQTYTVT